MDAIDFTSSFLTAYLHAVYLSLVSTQLKSHWTQKRCLEFTCIKRLDTAKVVSVTRLLSPDAVMTGWLYIDLGSLTLLGS